MTLGSLFDGSGTMPLVATLCDIEPVWASEIEPFPIMVTTKHFPNMKHYGDISKMDGAKIEPVDIISFGSPCQDLSVAGLRKGLEEGERSNLFYQAIRIIKEMRKATNGEFPKIAIWENVIGAFSSNGGEDFRSVLQSFVDVMGEEDGRKNTIPKSKKWEHAGCVMGDGYSIAWRVLDAQYWGVAQRRRRIYLVGSFTNGRSAEKILFESEGLSRHFAPCKEEKQGVTPRVKESVGGTGEESGDSRGVSVPYIDGWGGNMEKVFTDNVMNTIRVAQPQVLFDNTVEEKVIGLDSHPADSRVTISKDNKVQTLTSCMGTGGGNVPMLLKVVDSTVAIEGNGSRPSHHGDGYAESDVSYTLNTTEVHGVAYGIDRAAYNMGKNAKFTPSIEKELEPTLVSKGAGAVAHPVYTTSNAYYHTDVYEDVAYPLIASDYKDPPRVTQYPYYVVRRLTPVECARLQGFPDWWCTELGIKNPTEKDIAFWKDVWDTWDKINGSKEKSDKSLLKWIKDPYSDAAEYKMWGNGMALPCALYVMMGVAESLKEEENGN